jgi:hypothetical protein
MIHKCEAIVVHCMGYCLQSHINRWLEEKFPKGSHDRAVSAVLVT